MLCPKCNYELQVKTKFCPYCGAEIDTIDNTESTIDSNSVNEEKQDENISFENKELNTCIEPLNTSTEQTASTPESIPKSQPVYVQPQTVVVQNPSNGFAIAGFVCAFFCTLLGIIFSAIGLKKAKELNGAGKGLAIAGLVISICAMVVGIIIVCTSCAVSTVYWMY